MGIDPLHVQMLAAVLFVIGLGVTLARRNVFFTLMGIELMLNAVNLSFVGFHRTVPLAESGTGLLAPLFVIGLAAAEASIGLAMIVCLVRSGETVDGDHYAELKE